MNTKNVIQVKNDYLTKVIYFFSTFINLTLET